MRLQEKILAQSQATPKHDTEAQSIDEDSEDEDDDISDSKLLSIYDMHKNTGRSGNTPWKSIVNALDNKLTVHRVKARIKQLRVAMPKHTHSAKISKHKRAPVVDVDDDSITSRYEDRFAKFESQMNKLSEQCVVANAETAKCKKQNKLLQEENAKLNESLKQGINILLI